MLLAFFVGIMGRKKEKEQGIAADLFIEQGWTAKAIAEFLNVQETTVGKWRDAGKWDAMREENLSSPAKIKQIIRKEIVKVAGGEKSTVDADALSKLAKVYEAVEDRISVNVMFSIFKMFDNWMADQDPRLAVDFLKFHKLFLQHQVSISE